MLSPEWRDKILDYLQRRIDLSALIDWETAHVLALCKDVYSEDCTAVSCIEQALVGLEDGWITEDELRAELASVIPVTYTGSSNPTQVMEVSDATD